MNMRAIGTRRGFTLIEMIVSVALFAVVMLVAGATLLSLVYANRKAQALQSVMNNLNVSLDGIVRSVREGSNYRCGSPVEANGDCSSGGTALYFTPYGSDPTNRAEDWGYLFDNTGSYCGLHRICVSENEGPWIPITAPEVSITNMTFYVVGTVKGGGVQPKVVMIIDGTAGVASTKTTSNFNIQATATQRKLNL
jgi:prepilin-type N-terminal cleavage/methylation domain-containing protein